MYFQNGMCVKSDRLHVSCRHVCLRELSCGLRLEFVCVGLKQVVVCIGISSCLERRNQSKMLPPNPETATSDRKPYLGLESSHPWGFLPEVLRMLLGQTRAVPQEAMPGPHTGLSQKQGPGRGRLARPRSPCPTGPNLHSAGFPF